METATKIEILWRESIKPSSPTPPHRRTLNLSLLAQTYPSIHGSMIFFYISSTTNFDSLLKSLSETIVHFYPFAGRLKNDNSIDCNDEGVYVVQAQIKCRLQIFLQKPDLKLLKHLLPTSDPEISQLPTKPISLIQLNIFSCGGIAISVCVSKKIADSSSLFSFIKTWAAINSGLHESVGTPKFLGAPLFPPADLPIMGLNNVSGEDDLGRVWATRRLVFDAQKLSHLKAQSLIKKPTNFELVSALVSKCAMVSAPTSQNKTPSLLYRELNLKDGSMLEPPLPENAVGNHVWLFPVMFEESHNKKDLFEVLIKMKEGLTEFCDDVANGFEGDDSFLLAREILRDPIEASKMGVNIYCCTSLCELPLYEVDFGFGKPVWATSPMSSNNMFAFTETKWGEGVEVVVTLEERHMAAFERDEELLRFASFNPSATSSYCRL